MGKELVNSVNVLGKGNKVPDAVLVELTGAGLGQSKFDHLGNQGFREWLSEQTNSEKTYHDYLSYVKGMYVKGSADYGIDRPLTLTDEEEFNIADELMSDYIGSQATEYGVRKYLEYLIEERDYEEKKNARLLKEQLKGKGDKGKSRSRKDKIGSKVRSKAKVRTIYRQAPEHTATLRKDELYLFLRLMYDTAARVGDVQRLKWRDYDGDYMGKSLKDKPKRMKIEAARSKSEETGVAHLKPKTAELLKEHREFVQNSDDYSDDPGKYIFFQNRNTRKRNYRRIRRAFRAGGKDAGIPLEGKEKDEDFGTHNFRHSRLTHLGRAMLEDDDKDYSYSEVRERLRRYARHQDPSTTEVYIEILKEDYGIDIAEYTET